MATSKSITTYNPASFWARVCVGDVTSCWPFTGSSHLGYGVLNVKTPDGDRICRAHRLAYWFTHGNLPEVVMHTCDNPICVNPSHLRGGTQADNNLDCRLKGRYGNGWGKGRSAKPRTACHKGHELVGTNVYRHPRGAVQCVTCAKAYHRAFYLRTIDQRQSKGACIVCGDRLDPESVQLCTTHVLWRRAYDRGRKRSGKVRSA